MIEYLKGAYGLNLLFRVHGSAVYKSFVPSIVSVIVFLIFRLIYRIHNDDNLDHPYAVGVLVSSVSFLIIFRANNGYQRYWEACGAVHHMMSKWLDATVHTAAFHMQCDHYRDIKPPSFFDHPELLRMNVTRDRERTAVSLEDIADGLEEDAPSGSARFRSINKVEDKFHRPGYAPAQDAGPSSRPSLAGHKRASSRLLGPGRLDGGWGLLFEDDNGTNWNVSAANMKQPKESWANGKTPSLFLQELAHLSSLAVAVAFCTLRNDIEGSESPIDVYLPGSKWPEADPDQMTKFEKNNFFPRWLILKNLRYWFGMDRTPMARTQYNAARPMMVIGGVSDNEIALLQKARGASAKTTLAWMWLSEFIAREHLAGSTGNVGPPIISRLFQFLSDGMIYYNHARKIMYIPFPFPHAQLSALFVFVMVIAVPFMMEQYTDNLIIGILLTFATVNCLAGLHEVARELENPFRNVPNDIPLCTLLAMYNESLVAMCSGFHPDLYWDAELYQDTLVRKLRNKEKKKKPTTTTTTTEYDKTIETLKESLVRQEKEIEELKLLVRNQSNSGRLKPTKVERRVKSANAVERSVVGSNHL